MTDDQLNERASELSFGMYNLAKHSITMPYPENDCWSIDEKGNLSITVVFERGMWEKEDE